MSTAVSVDDEWRMFLNSQSTGLDLSSRVLMNSQWMEPNRVIEATVSAVAKDVVDANAKPKIKITPKKMSSGSVLRVSEEPTSVLNSEYPVLSNSTKTKQSIVRKPTIPISTSVHKHIAHNGSGVGLDDDDDNTEKSGSDGSSEDDDDEDDTETETNSEHESESDENTKRTSSQKTGLGVGTAVIEQDNEVDEEQSMVSNTLYISTKTKVLFLNQTMDLSSLFWSIPITEYWRPVECVVKKQMKIVSNTPEEYQELVEKLKDVPYYTEHVIKQIDNPNARRIKFKDERKITIGVSKKDIMNYRCKVKNAFYNCFAIIIRFKYQNAFKEIHVKVFNTGKLEIPGVLNKEILDIVSKKIIDVLQPFVPLPLGYVEETQEENVLINSNFNCGYYINREELFNILRAEPYGIETSYDPCIYPGIKCKFYFNNEIGLDRIRQTGNFASEERNMKKQQLLDSKKYTEVSFMIFRTGSCLIVGNCPENTLVFVFEFIRDILLEQREHICVKHDDVPMKGKKPKQRKKNVSITTNYYTKIINANV